MRTKNQDFVVNIHIVKREVIDEARRYIPELTFRASLLRKVKNERTLLIIPATNKVIVKPALTLTKDEYWIKVVFCFISYRRMLSRDKPILSEHPPPRKQLLPFRTRNHQSETCITRLFDLLTDEAESDVRCSKCVDLKYASARGNIGCWNEYVGRI